MKNVLHSFKFSNMIFSLFLGENLSLYLAELGYIQFSKQCRSGSAGFLEAAFKFSDFFTSLHLIRRKNIVFCPTTINLIIISPIIHKLLKNLDVGGVNGYLFAII